MAENDLERDSVDMGLTSDVKIADEVVGTIAVLAASDVDGVVSMAGTDIGSIFGVKSAKRGLKAIISDEEVSFHLSLIVRYGCNIPKVCSLVREKVKNTVENMTGLKVTAVKITISGIEVAKA